MTLKYGDKKLYLHLRGSLKETIYGLKSSLDFTRGPPSTGFRYSSSLPSHTHGKEERYPLQERWTARRAAKGGWNLDCAALPTRVHYLWRQGNKRCRVPDNDTCDQSVTTGHGSLGLGSEKYAIRQHQKRKSFELSRAFRHSFKKTSCIKTFAFCSWYFSYESVHFFGNMILQNWRFPEK